jgi:drug/metabolite transporter (DMT)-like permease
LQRGRLAQGQASTSVCFGVSSNINAMLVSDRALFWLPTLIWASTWHVILYQLGSVAPINSVAYRFALASLVLFGMALWRKEVLRQPLRTHGMLALTGAVQYGFNYCAVYLAETYIPSGLVAVLFSLMVFSNAIAGAWFFGRPVTARFMAGGLVGVMGVSLIFWPELATASARSHAGLGLVIGLAAVIAATIGNVLTLRLSERGMALVPTLAWSMAWGACLLSLGAWVSGVGFSFDWHASYLASLAYLALFGSVAAFFFYFKLAKRQGMGRAGITAVVIPVLALAISAAFEGWHPTLLAMVGMGMCVASVWTTTSAPAATKPTQ